jgi:hypothetical protein
LPGGAGLAARHGPDAESRRFIPPTVRNYVGILATGENRKTFKPQDLSRVHIADRQRSNVVFLPFPGKHSTVAQNSDPNAREVSDVVWTLAYRFLDYFGTDHSADVKPPLNSREAMLDSYSGIVLKRDAYAAIKQRGAYQKAIGKGFATREFTRNLADYVKNASYFVNEHHRGLFKLCCRNLYDWLFTRIHGQLGGFDRTVMRGDPVYADLERLYCRLDFMKSLAQLGVRREQRDAYILPPAGSFHHAGATQNLRLRANLQAMGLL